MGDIVADLSIIIPARNEEFLQNTIDDILKNIRGDTEIIVILDGYWPEKGIPVNPKVTVVHHEESIGQRASVNEGARISKAKYIMKLDAHCAVDKAFDLKLAKDCEYDWTVIPRMYNLWAFDWKCFKCGKRTYQAEGKPDKCADCGSTDRFKKKIVWKEKRNPTSDFMRFNKEMNFKYWGDYKDRPEAQGDICDLMSSIGACFFMHRERFWDLGGMDEGHGSWGQFGTEVACKSWLSGGRHVINKKTWFVYMFRTGGGFSAPWPGIGKATQFAKKYSRNLWLNDKWDKAIHPLSWLIDKFSPIPDWHTPDAESNKQRENKKRKIKTPDPLPPSQGMDTPTDVLTKGIVYYTNNQCEERVLSIVRNQLEKVRNGYPIVSVSQYPINFGNNIVMPLKSSVLSMFKQILRGIEESKSDILFLTEHDVIYHPSHFDFIPPKKDVFYYNLNNWKLDVGSGQALFWECQQVLALCAYREVLLKHYRARVAKVEKEGHNMYIGYEPGNRPPPRGVDHYKAESWMSEHPNLDLRHKHNLTPNRWDKKKFRREPKGWQLADEIPFWGKTKGMGDQVLRDVNDGKYDI